MSQKIAQNAIKEIPANLPTIPDGYVYLGRGQSFKYDGEASHYGAFASFSDKWSLDGNKAVILNYSSMHYIFPEDSETVKINMPQKTFQEELKEAKTLIGKSNGSWIASRVRVFIADDGAHPSISSMFEIKKKGYSISVESADGRFNQTYSNFKVEDPLYLGVHEIDFSRVKKDGVIKICNSLFEINYFLELEKLLETNNRGNSSLCSFRFDGLWVFSADEVKKITERIKNHI